MQKDSPTLSPHSCVPLSLPKVKARYLERGDKVIVFTLADFTRDYLEDSNNGHFRHDPPVSIGACAHGGPITNVDDVLPAPPHFEGVVFISKRLVEISLGLPLIHSLLSLEVARGL